MRKWLIESSRSSLCAFRWGIGRTGQEAVELHQELEVDIVALGRLAVGAAHVVAVEINTYSERKSHRQLFWFKYALPGASQRTISRLFAESMREELAVRCSDAACTS